MEETKKMKVIIIFGTRPEAIKMCPLVQELQLHPNMTTRVVVTGQHRQMLDQVLSAFDVVPDFDLSIMRERQDLFDVTVGVLQGIKSILACEKPDIVLVHGDTTTSYAAALASYYLKIPVGHVEAGLRTNNIYSPFPEEFNRQSVGLIARYHFAPTEMAKENLIREGKDPASVFVTGNTVIDALSTTVRKTYDHELLRWANGSRLVLLTAHRRENLGQPMEQMFRGIRAVVDELPDVKLLYPVHMNPAVREIAERNFSGCDRIRLVEPLDVLNFHNLLARCYLVLTDSGGIQEEASALGKPVLVMRNTTERPEGLAAGILKLVGTNEDTIYREFKSILSDSHAYAAMSCAANPYGDGFASQRIAAILEKEWE